MLTCGNATHRTRRLVPQGEVLRVHPRLVNFAKTERFHLCRTSGHSGRKHSPSARGRTVHENYQSPWHYEATSPTTHRWHEQATDQEYQNGRELMGCQLTISLSNPSWMTVIIIQNHNKVKRKRRQQSENHYNVPFTPPRLHGGDRVGPPTKLTYPESNQRPSVGPKPKVPKEAVDEESMCPVIRSTFDEHARGDQSSDQANPGKAINERRGPPGQPCKVRVRC